MRALDFLKELHHEWCYFQTKEGAKIGEASNAELKRWFDNKAVIIGGKATNWNDEIEFPIKSMVLFPKHPITLR